MSQELLFTEDELREFKEIYRDEYGETLDDKTTLEIASNFFNLIRTISKNTIDDKKK